MLERLYNPAHSSRKESRLLEWNDEYFMTEALKEAGRAAEQGEVPVGAVIVHGESSIIARAHNQTEMLHDATAHAEMLAITQAAEHLENWRLLDCTLYVTIEPCTMCCGAMVLSRLPRLVYGADDPKHGAVRSISNALGNEKFNHEVKVISGILKGETSAILSEFFQRLRSRSKPDGNGSS